jgi:hypothetical protein
MFGMMMIEYPGRPCMTVYQYPNAATCSVDVAMPIVVCDTEPFIRMPVDAILTPPLLMTPLPRRCCANTSAAVATSMVQAMKTCTVARIDQ